MQSCDRCLLSDCGSRIDLEVIVYGFCSVRTTPKINKHVDAVGIVMQLSEYSLDPVRDDGEFYSAGSRETNRTAFPSADPGFNLVQPREEDRSRITIEERTGLGQGGAAMVLERGRRTSLKILAARLSMDSFRGRWR